MQKLLKIVFLAPVLTPVAFVILTIATSLFDQQSLAQAASPHVKSAHQGALAEPLITGTDGSQTGVAKFQGNLTAITAPSGQALVLSREPDCSLSLFTGTISLTPHFSYGSTGFFADYERVLHTNAGLTTTPGASSTCASPTTGFSSRRGVYVGQTTTGLQVFASIYYNPMLGANALLISSGITSFTWTALSFSAAGSVTTADLNGDGNGDLVVVNGNTGATPTAQVFVLLGNPDGTFQTAVPYTVPGTASISAVIDDVNGDGKLDIIASSDNGQISVFTGKGDGTFSSAQSFAAPTPVYPGSTLTPSTALTNLITADLRGTKKKDIIASNGLVLLNDGAGNFTAATSAAFPPLTANSNLGPNLATGDFNKDGKLDLVVSTGGAVLTWLGKGDGTFTPGPGYVTVNTNGFVTVSDLDGDGNPDVYIGEANGGFYFGDDLNLSYALMGNGDGTFQGAPTISGGYTGTNLGDVNGDGQPDLITPTTGTVNGLPAVFTVQLGTSKGAFNPVSTITLPATIVVNGFNGPTTLNTAGAVASSFAVADLNGDGKADLAFVIQTLPTVPTSGFSTLFPSPIYFIALSNGDGTFATPVPYVFPQIAPSSGFDISLSADGLHIGDFNHDGHNDLIFTFNEVAGSSAPVPNPYNRGFAVLLGNGNGTFQTTPIITTTYTSVTAPTIALVPQIVSVADLNGDSNPDLIANVPGTTIVNFQLQTQLQVYLSNGDGTFKPPTTVAIGADAYGIPVLADFNKDGKLDLAALAETSSGQAELAISLGNGDGTFATPTILNVGGGDAIRSSGIAAGDFDGNVDLALLDSSDFSGIFYGKGDGTFTSVSGSGTTYPKDLINLDAAGTSVAVDLNKDGKTDLLVGNVILLNTYATAPTIVTQTNTTTTLTASATSIASGASVTFTAIVSPATGSAIPTGAILFADGDLTIGSANVDATGKATFTTISLATGSHSVTAGFGGSTTFLGSISPTITVNVTGTAATATTTALTASASSITTGGSITFTASITPAAGSTGTPTGTVNFLDGTTTLGSGTVASGKATFTTTALTTGSHNITAAYSGDAAFSPSTSSIVTITVNAAPAADFTISLSPASATVARSASVTSTITITPSGGFKQAVALTCIGAPTNSTCTLSPTTVTPADGVTAVTATLTFQASVTTTASSRSFHNIEFAATLPLGLLASTALFGLRRRRWPLQLIALATATVLLAATGCGGGSKPATNTTNTPTPGTYPLTVTATSGATSHSTTYTVTIQ
jgi:hypothetical protein